MNYDNKSWQQALEKEQPLENFVLSNYQLIRHESGLFAGEPVIKLQETISASLIKKGNLPYGNLKSPTPQVQITNKKKPIRSRYAISGLRQKLEKMPSEYSEQYLGFPSIAKKILLGRNDVLIESIRVLELEDMEQFLSGMESYQERARERYCRELVPLMNANPFDPALDKGGLKQRLFAYDPEGESFPPCYEYETALSDALVRNLQEHVDFQNKPLLYFDLMQELEREVMMYRWVCKHTSDQEKTSLDALVYIMDSWKCSAEDNRPPHVDIPSGVPIQLL